MDKQKDSVAHKRREKILDVLIPAACIIGFGIFIGFGLWLGGTLTHRSVQIHFNHYDALTNTPLIEEKQVNATMLYDCGRNLCGLEDGAWKELETMTASTDYPATKQSYYTFVPYPIHFSLKGIDPYVVSVHALQDANKYTMDTKYTDTNGDGMKEWRVTIWLTPETLDKLNNEVTINVPWYDAEYQFHAGEQ